MEYRSSVTVRPIIKSVGRGERFRRGQRGGQIPVNGWNTSGSPYRWLLVCTRPWSGSDSSGWLSSHHPSLHLPASSPPSWWNPPKTDQTVSLNVFPSRLKRVWTRHFIIAPQLMGSLSVCKTFLELQNCVGWAVWCCFSGSCFKQVAFSGKSCCDSKNVEGEFKHVRKLSAEQRPVPEDGRLHCCWF